MIQLPPARSIQLAPFVDSNGKVEEPIQLSVHEAGSGPAVVLCHGFPEFAFSWRHQVAPLADAGFRVIVPNQRGYPGSDSPAGSDAYDIDHLTGDLVALLDALEIEKAVFVGHDWGGFVVWAMSTLHPDRVLGVVGVNTPYLPRMPIPPTEVMKLVAEGDDDRLYILWFQQPGVAEAVLDRSPRLLFEKIMRRPRSLEDFTSQMNDAEGPMDMNPFRRLEELEILGDELLSPEELDHYTSAFETNGFRAPISWYRNFDRNWNIQPEVGSASIEHPCLMLTAEWDVVLPPALAESMPERIPDLETVMIEGCGHWTQQEKPEEFNRLLIDWLQRRFR